MSKVDIVSSFVEDTPPGELSEVIADIKSLAEDDPRIIDGIAPAIEKYNKEQLITTKLPGGSQLVIISEYNELEPGRFFDSESSTSFSFNHTTQKASDAQSFPLEGESASTVKKLIGDVSAHVSEHYPSQPAYGVYPASDGTAILIVGSKYSPSNYWNGRWRSTYILDHSSTTLTGHIQVDVHYYEDGNVRLLTNKPIEEPVRGGVGKTIAAIEKKYQEELNRAFNALSEGAFKSLRRQLPVTRQKVDWDKISGYRLGQDIGGGRAR